MTQAQTRRSGDRRRQCGALRRADGARSRRFRAHARIRAARMAWRQFHACAQSALHARRAAGRAGRSLWEEEYWQDLLKVTGGLTDEKLARLAIRHSSQCRPWMIRHGVRFSRRCRRHVARTNAFFMGGGKALVNAHYRSAQSRRRRALRFSGEGKSNSTMAASGRPSPRRGAFAARACVLACGGFRSNLEWQREAWGQNERGEWTAEIS